MRAKKLATEDGDEILMVLKGAKHITSSVSTDAQFMALTATSPHNWPAVDCSIGVSANSFNSDKSLALDKEHSKSCQEEEQSICGNSSFLRRFIEFRINDSDLSLKMTSGNEKSNVESSGAGKREMKILFTSPGSEDQPSIESSADGANSVASKKPLPDYSDNTSTYPTDMLSRSAIHKERNDSGLQNEEFSPKQSEGNTGRNQVTGDIIRHVFPKIPTIRRVDELRIRIEGNLETTDSTKKVCTIGNSVINNYADEKYSIKSAPEVKEHRSKVEVRRSNSNTRENPPRKVSFKIRSSSNNGRLSSSYISSATSRRSSALSKGSLTDSKIPSKVAVLASKFNAIIHENKEEKSVEIIQNDSRMLPQFPAGSITPANKKQPQTERAFVSRRNSSNSKREGCLSSTGGNTKSGFLGVALRKHSSTKQPLLEPDNSQKSSNSSITKDCKRRSNMSCRSSAVGTKSGSVKAAIQIFEKNATTTRPAKINAVALGGNRKNVGNSVTCELKQSLESSEAKKEPKYPRVIFKRDATLVRVTLDCEDVCNEDQTTKQVEDSCNTRTNDCQKSATKLSRGSCEDEEKVCVKNDYVEGFNARCKSDKNVTVVGVGGGSGHDEMKKKEEKIKPVVPVKNVTKKQIYKSVPFFKSDTNDSKYAKVTCKQDSIYRTTGNGSVTENTCVHYDKLAFPHKAPAGSEYSINKIASTREREDFQETDRELMTPNRSFLWGVSPPSNKVRTQDDQSTSVSVPLTDNYEPTNPEVPAPVTNCSIEETYDDVYPPSTVYSDGVSLMHPYSVVHPQDDDMYDDVGSPATEEKQSPRIPAISAVSNCADDNGTDSGYDYCRGSVEPSLDQNYDDCEGEGYQCIGEDNPHEDAESNIYDDVKSVTTLKVSEDVASISNCYESIYSGGDRSMTSDGRTTIDGGTMRMGGPSSASSSIGSGNHSFCDQSNSLYGVGGCRFDSASVSQASTVSAEDGPHEVLSYQLTCVSSRQPRSETSDEWVDIEMTDSDGEGSEDAVAVYQGHCRNWKSPRRSRKARKLWSKSARKATGNLIDVYVSSSSVLYLGAPDPHAHKPSVSPHQRSSGSTGLVSLRAILYIGDAHESQEMTFFLEKEGGEYSSDSDADHHYEMLYEVVGNSKNNEVPYDDFDSFDSDASDETYIKPLHQAGFDIGNGRLPEPPPGQNIYAISKIAEAAGKKMLKLGKSLRKIRTKRSNSRAPEAQHNARPPLPTTQRPQPPSPSHPSPPVLPPRISEKTLSSGNLAGRKYWSLHKFKRSISASDQTSPAPPFSGPKKETATFYLTQALDADMGSTEGNMNVGSTDTTDICSESGGTPTSPSSLGSSKTIVYDSGMDANCNSEGLQKMPTNFSNSNKQRPTSAPERRNSGSVRPNSPPPLPPHSSGSSDNPKKPLRKEKRNSSNTSWYAECGLFDQTEVQNMGIMDVPKNNARKQDRPISNSWYAEVGLWDMGTSSPNDSSLSEQDTRSQHTDLSGGDSPLTAGSPENSGVAERRFADEPLYQFYTAAVAERYMRSELDSDGYEEIGDGSQKLKPSRPTAMELIQPREGQHRTLWCEIPEVVNSRVLSTISTHQKKLQEAKFEIITSEASYINSLNVLEKHFISSLELCDESVLSRNDRRTLFSNLIPVKTCSEHFLAELEECWQDNILLHGICEVVYKHASNNFNAYIKYCSNQICLDRTLRGLKEHNTKFSEALSQLENSPVCQSLSLHSFLMLPMQRITRLPLLIDAVLTRLDPQDDEYNTCRLALATLNKIVQNCNEDARKMERLEEILILSRQLYFPNEIKAVPIISSVRWLVKKGELTQVVWRGDEGKLTFGKKFSRVQVHIFLFTDLLVITKKKRKTAPDATGDECYAVVDYCPRNLVQMTSAEGTTNLPVKFTSESGRNLMLLTMLQNHEKKTVEMILSCSVESDRQRWLEAVSPPVSDNPNETVYEEWDCPQVTAIHPYVACQPDELSLEVADVVNVLRKITDGWYQGERIRDGERGWFPGNHTVEVLSAHVRARNLRQRYRLLALSGNFLEAQRKEKQTK